MATPIAVQKARENAKKGKVAPAKQGTLDAVVRKVETPTSFSPKSILREVTRHVVVNDQVRSGSSESADDEL